MTSEKTIAVEFFFAGGCEHCVAERGALRNAALAIPHVQWNEIDIGKSPQRAVAAGVVGTPALAIGGELIFASTPSPDELQRAIRLRSKAD